MDACRVQLRGWDSPHLRRDLYRLHEEQDAIGQSGEWMSYLEARPTRRLPANHRAGGRAHSQHGF